MRAGTLVRGSAGPERSAYGVGFGPCSRTSPRGPTRVMSLGPTPCGTTDSGRGGGGCAQRFITITGGKFCPFRLMAEDTVDALCAEVGVDRPCRTAEEPLPDSEKGRHYWLGSRVERRETTLHEDQLICECELVPRRRL